jgi:chemotaxis protein CheX
LNIEKPALFLNMTKSLEQMETLTRAAVREVFKSMASLEVADEAHSPIADGGGHVGASVGFVGDDTNGVVFLYMGAAFARRATGKMLGIPERELEGEETVNDAVGELANMIAGYVKTRLASSGRPCALTIPSIVRGRDLTVEGSAAVTRKVIAFRCDNQVFLTALSLKDSTTHN